MAEGASVRRVPGRPDSEQFSWGRGMAEHSAVDLKLDQAHSARMYDYYLGGTTNFPADREAAGRALAAFPGDR